MGPILRCYNITIVINYVKFAPHGLADSIRTIFKKAI